MPKITFGETVNGFVIEHISKIDDTTGVLIGRRRSATGQPVDFFVVSTFTLGASEWHSGYYTKNFGKAVEVYTDTISAIDVTEDCE